MSTLNKLKRLELAKRDGRIQRLASALIAVFALLGFAATASAMSMGSLTIDAEPILMIDGTGDSSVTIYSTTATYNFGYWNGSFQSILSAGSIMTTSDFVAGQIVDFAIQSTADLSIVHRLSDGPPAVLVFTAPIAASNSVTPVVLTDYWQSVTITWAVGNNNLVFSMMGGADGFAPGSAAPIPEPTAAIVFAVGLVLAGGRVRRQPRA